MVTPPPLLTRPRSYSVPLSTPLSVSSLWRRSTAGRIPGRPSWLYRRKIGFGSKPLTFSTFTRRPRAPEIYMEYVWSIFSNIRALHRPYALVSTAIASPSTRSILGILSIYGNNRYLWAWRWDGFPWGRGGGKAGRGKRPCMVMMRPYMVIMRPYMVCSSLGGVVWVLPVWLRAAR